MATGPQKGRDMVLKLNGVAIAGVRTKSFSIAGEPIDGTNDDDSGIRALLDAPGEVQINFSVSGVVKDDSLLQVSLSNTDRVNAMTLVRPDGGTLDGSFFLSSYSETGEYQGGVMFECECQSAGAVTYTKT